MKQWILAAGIMLLGFGLQGASFAEEELHEEYSLELKGFSPAMVDLAEVQISRMEGRYPATPPTAKQQRKYNFLNGEWIEPVQPFGYNTMPNPKYPKRP